MPAAGFLARACVGQTKGAARRATGDLRLWYRQPAANWNEALPIGNGRLAAMVFGGVEAERLQLNEDTVWAGERRDRINPEGARNLPEVRRLLFAGKPREAEAFAERTIIATPKRMPPYQPLGDLLLRFKGQGGAEDYVRELDIDAGVARVSYRSDGVRYTREVFSSHPDQLIVVRLTCERPGRLSFDATLSRESDSRTRAVGTDRVMLEGEAIARGDKHAQERKVGVKFNGLLKVFAEGGRTQTDGDRVSVEGADAATLLFVAATNFRHKDPSAKCEQYLTAAARKPFKTLRAAHVADHRRLFRRVEFNLGVVAPDLPTDERLKRVQGGATDLALEALYFQFGRYLLIAQQPAGHDGRESSGQLERLARAVLGQQVHHQHQHRDELLAGRGLQSLGTARAALRSDRQRARRRPPRGEEALRRARLRDPPQHGHLGARRADRRRGLRHLADGRRVAEPAPLGPLRLHARPRVPRRRAPIR